MITYNEIDHIKEAISNLEFADEIIVIDSFSTDGTFEAVSAMNGVKIVQRSFQNFADQRNFAIDQATRDWIFFMDADERLTQASQEEIVETAKHNNGIEAFKIPRRFMFNDKMMRFSGLQTDRVARLFKRGVTRYYKHKTVHELLDYQGHFGTLRNNMLHYSFDNYESYKKKTEHYGRLKAQILYEKGMHPYAFHFYIEPAYKFLYNYLFRLGILDGKEGYTICKFKAYGVFFRYKVLEKLLSGTPE